MFVCVVPIEVFLVSAVLAAPRRWLGAGAVVAMGSALGTLALSLLIGWDRAWILGHVLPAAAVASESARSVAALLDAHRGLAVALVAASPFPQQPAVVAAALAGMPAGEIALGVLVGRAAKYLLVAWCAAYAPGVVRRFRRAEVTSSSSRPGP